MSREGAFFEKPSGLLEFVFGDSDRVIRNTLRSVEDSERRVFLDDTVDVGVVQQCLDHVGLIPFSRFREQGPLVAGGSASPGGLILQNRKSGE